MAYIFELTDQPRDEDKRIWDNLYQLNMQFTEEDQHKLLRVFARDESGGSVGGLLGETVWHWLYISIVWVYENHRHTGLGSQLVARAEAEVARRGCRHAY
jgi:GNAT superfamily N-acetyltransferase